MLPFVFVHIPKTAGTSLRKGLEAALSREVIEYDYGLDSAETTPLVREFIYERKDPWLFRQKCCSQNVKVVAGHFAAEKYVHLFGAERLVTFLREPLQRIISEFKHFQRHNGFEGSFEDYFNRPSFKNRQTALIGQVPIPLCGFVGLTDYFMESLTQAGEFMQIDIPNLELNLGKRATSDTHEIAPEVLNRLRKQNLQDLNLYQKTRDWWAQVHVQRDGKAPLLRGEIDSLADNKIAGWAFWDDSNRAAVLEVLVEGKPVGICKATLFKPRLNMYRARRNGYVGFEKTLRDLRPGQRVEVRAKSTQQQLFGSPLVFNR